MSTSSAKPAGMPSKIAVTAGPCDSPAVKNRMGIINPSKNSIINPNSDYVFSEFDRIMLIGDTDKLENLDDFASNETSKWHITYIMYNRIYI